MSTEVRFPVKPQMWLWWINVPLQPALSALFAWLALGGDPASGIGTRIFGAVMSIATAALGLVAVRVILRMRGKRPEIVLDQTSLVVPAMLRNSSTSVPLASVVGATVQETRSNGVSFYQLSIEYNADGGIRKSVTIASQFVGPDAFSGLCDNLRARGIHVA